MRGYKFDAAADREFTEAIKYYRIRSSRAARNFVEEFDRCLTYVCTFPEGSTVREKLVQSKSLHRYPYNILYMLHDDIVYIVAVAHHSRHPGYWKDRLRDAPD
ncbi:MAG: hypothetical protein CVV45_17745 [Spirochaetae bacterium HGW-Spirochaetae-10]|nr:MAG: hypothetical protein CVV45_17745 [Spirochaetae bacterium HGW-Spirochaetae-10]